MKNIQFPVNEKNVNLKTKYFPLFIKSGKA